MAENAWPGVLILEPTAWSRTTEITVSAGTMIVFGGAGVSGWREADLDELEDDPPEDFAASAEEPEDVASAADCAEEPAC